MMQQEGCDSPTFLDFPASRTVSQINSFCLLFTQSVEFCYGSKNRTKRGFLKSKQSLICLTGSFGLSNAESRGKGERRDFQGNMWGVRVLVLTEKQLCEV
jgi:hypothetical protein